MCVLVCIKLQNVPCLSECGAVAQSSSAWLQGPKASQASADSMSDTVEFSDLTLTISRANAMNTIAICNYIKMLWKTSNSFPYY